MATRIVVVPPNQVTSLFDLAAANAFIPNLEEDQPYIIQNIGGGNITLAMLDGEPLGNRLFGFEIPVGHYFCFTPDNGDKPYVLGSKETKIAIDEAS